MATPSGPLLHAFHTVLTEEPCETLKNIFKKLSLGGKKITGEILENCWHIL